MQTGKLTTKPHYPILDGLRGVAAILVVLYHLFEGYFPTPIIHPAPGMRVMQDAFIYSAGSRRGYLAVDFFFMLSGFVIGYAYDDRWGKMSIKAFYIRRLIRLQPMVVLGILLGAISFWFNPFIADHNHISFVELVVATLISITLMPSPDVYGSSNPWSLNGPCWSLFQEYIANIMYALFMRKLSKKSLLLIVVTSGIVLSIISISNGNIDMGWNYSTLWVGFIRMIFSFVAGLLLFRSKKLIRLPYAFTVCSIILIGSVYLPVFQFNGLYEAVCIIIFFPLIILCGAGGEIQGKSKKLCRFLGDISYPIYILHAPFIYIFNKYVFYNKQSMQGFMVISSGMVLFLILLAYAVLKLYDEPVRALLKRRSAR
jgi:peptidoglycan/LPS O-acetylase OafA/YrhL